MNPVYFPKSDPRNPGIPLAAHGVYPPTDAASWHSARGAVYKTAAQTDPRNQGIPLPAHAVYPPTVGGSYSNNGYSAYPQHAVAYPSGGPRQVAAAGMGQLAYPYGPYTTSAGMVHTPAAGYPLNLTYTQAGAASYMQAAAYAQSLSGSQVVHSTTVMQQPPYHTVYLPDQSPMHGMSSQAPVSAAAAAQVSVSPYGNRALPPTAIAGAAVGVSSAGMSPYGGPGLPPGWAYRYPQSQYHPPPQ